jgi:endonuclease-8
MPEGDTLARTAEVLRRVLLGATLTGAEARAGRALRRAPDLSPLVGGEVVEVAARGKHLLITVQLPEAVAGAAAAGGAAGGGTAGGGTAGGGGAAARTARRLTLRTHLRMRGSWHRYRPNEAWQLPAWRASVILRTDDAVAVCFDCPTAELLTDVGLARSPVLNALGPDLLHPSADLDEAVGRLRRRGTPAGSHVAIGEALLDQRVVAGIGNVVRNEVLFLERVNPWRPVPALSDGVLRALLARAASVLVANTRGGRRVTTGVDRPGANLWVYGRAGRPCRRCGTPIRVSRQGPLARLTYWCPRCQE